jgi:hypothetical protein
MTIYCKEKWSGFYHILAISTRIFKIKDLFHTQASILETARWGAKLVLFVVIRQKTCAILNFHNGLFRIMLDYFLEKSKYG